MPQSSLVCYRAVAVPSVFVRLRRNASGGVIAPVRLAVHAAVKLNDNILGEKKLKHIFRVIYANWEAMSYVVAESPNSRIVARTDVFSRKVGESVDVNRDSSLTLIPEEQFFRLQLAFAVIRAGVTP